MVSELRNAKTSQTTLSLPFHSHRTTEVETSLFYLNSSLKTLASIAPPGSSWSFANPHACQCLSLASRCLSLSLKSLLTALAEGQHEVYLRSGDIIIVNYRKVSRQTFFDVEFPRGHVGIKNLQAELVDEHGNSIPLYEAYLHHYFVLRYFENITMSQHANKSQPNYGKYFKRNDGACQTFVNSISWGLGVDARRTSTELPDPFRVEVGTHPEDVPKEYDEEKWLINILVIDTRGVEDKKGCSQCRCDLLDVKSKDLTNTTGVDGTPLPSDYKGGIFCCEKKSQCKLQQGYNEKQKRKVAIKYTISWVEWDQQQVPLKFYILDVTDQVTYNGSEPIHHCAVEYSINPEKTDEGHYHIKKTNIPMTKGGSLIYITAHVHSGIVNATLYGEDGRRLCEIKPIYGTGKEAGNEEGYAVGASGCYPKPGSMKIKDGENLTVEFIHENKYTTGLWGISMSIWQKTYQNLCKIIEHY
nr:uncharacterized protein LOC112720885 [Arachis hypogaea]